VAHLALQLHEGEKKETSVDKKDALTIPSLHGTHVLREYDEIVEPVGGNIRRTTFEHGGSAQFGRSGMRQRQ
jgi:hypothetical protein